ncbi:hypothetical protein [Flavivirga aquatica]|uniref:hypothetical protein n=1 Tax=Flavivirga aquatica TaxID=1849968 RepID=UPI0013F4C284|nr:hypothetical protein [Flavivirga aquatica]
MKKIIIALMVIVFNIFLFSCTNDSIAEEDALFEQVQATDGGTGKIKPPPSFQ